MKKIIIGNWKMNPASVKEAKQIFFDIKKLTGKAKKVKIAICPPFVFLPEFSGKTSHNLSIGAQDVFWQDEGAFTGEISAKMLKALKAEFVILGHSERRELGETNKEISLKVKKTLDSKLKPVVCIGESKRDSEGKYLEFLEVQIKQIFSKIPKKQVKNIIVAYEPVWAISKGKRGGKALKGEGVYQMSIFIKKVLSDIFGRKEAEKVLVIYGGSSGPENTEDILQNGRVDGLLPGSNSLKPEKFSEMVKIAESVSYLPPGK